jgi:hypothetical protein
MPAWKKAAVFAQTLYLPIVMRKILLFTGLIAILNSCFEQGDCTDVSSNILKIGFYDFASRAAKTIALDSIKIEGSSLVFNKATSVTSVALPLHPEAESITYLFYLGNSVTPLEVQYKIKTFALAPDCLAIDIYSVTEATGESINQIFFKQREISQNATENIQLYF